MKKTFFLLIVFVIFLCQPSEAGDRKAQSAVSSKASVIQGVWERNGTDQIKLFEVDKGSLRQIAMSELTSGKQFHFTFVPQQESFYVIGPDEHGIIDNYTFYFKPGDDLNVKITDNSYELFGENTAENEEMARWHDFMLPLETSMIYVNSTTPSTYKNYFPLLEKKHSEMGNYKQKDTANPVFNRMFPTYRELDMLNTALNFLVMGRTMHPSTDDFVDYYKNIDISAFASDDDLLFFPYGMSVIKNYGFTAASIAPSKFTEEEILKFSDIIRVLDVTLPMVGNDIIKSEMVIDASKWLNTREGYMDFEKRFGKYFLTEEQITQFKAKLQDMPPFATPGDMAVDFRFPDADGNEIAMSDFRGKLVYVDVWATWCGPCMSEVPHLKKLEEEYRDKDIVFIGVSIDEPKDRQKWLNTIVEKGLKGIQLFAGDASDRIIEPYKIAGVPRFILVGKDGRLIMDSAPRPSTFEIRPLLDAMLQK